MRKFFWLALLAGVCSVVPTAFAWGEEGHKTIGAMVDKLIAGTPAAAHVHALLQNETLSDASVWADVVKTRKGQTPEMLQFKQSNPNHYSFHYTDIPFEETAYSEKSIGATNTDLIHAIPACIAILQGKTNEQTLFTNVSPRVALRLLVHYIEDLHQPLHVGAGYLDGTNFVDPNGYAKPAKDDKGGNSLVFGTNNLHGYWDYSFVQMDMNKHNATTPQAYANFLLTKPAPAWQDSAPMPRWEYDWANESLALAAKVHNVTVLDEDDSKMDNRTGKPRAQWHINPPSPEYTDWAEKTIEDQLEKAGYRIAEVLKTIWPS